MIAQLGGIVDGRRNLADLHLKRVASLVQERSMEGSSHFGSWASRTQLVGASGGRWYPLIPMKHSADRGGDPEDRDDLASCWTTAALSTLIGM